MKQLTLFDFCLRGHARTLDNVYSHGECRACAIQRARAWAQEHPEQTRSYYGRKLAADPQYFARKQARQRREKPELVAKVKARYRQRNEALAQDRESKVRRRYGRSDSDSVDYAKLVATDPCCYCGGEGGTVDHIVPVSAGGPNHWANYSSACVLCNSAKNNRSLLVFLSRQVMLIGAR